VQDPTTSAEPDSDSASSISDDDGEPFRPGGLKFLSPDELGAEDDVKFLIEDYVSVDGKTLIAARPKVGKSTLAFAMATALMREVPSFLSKRVDGSGVGVLYCTEEASRAAIKTKVAQFQITNDDPILILRHVDTVGATWQDTVERLRQAAAECKERWGVAHVLVIIDGLFKWAGFGEGQENDQSVAGRAINALDPISGDGHAVVVLHHAPWGADRARGSTNIVGQVDLCLFVSGEGDEPRTITHQGGRLGYTCQPNTYRLTGDGGLETLGYMPTKSATKLDAALRFLESRADDPPTTAEVADVLGVTSRTALNYLNRAERLLCAKRLPAGRAGDFIVRWAHTNPIEMIFGASDA
jgi:AAA domain